MSILALTDQNFSETINGTQKPVLVDFWASWCGPCRMFGPIFEATAEKRDDAVFAKVNVDEEQETAMQYRIMTIPTVMVFKNGEAVKKISGVLSEKDLSELIEDVI